MRIKLACDSCGENRFAFPDGGDDESEVICAECSQLVGTMGDLKHLVAQAVIQKRPVPVVHKTVRITDAR